MSITAKVKKTLVLEFSLPTEVWSSNSSGGSERTLNPLGESWALTIYPETALDVALTFEELARAIRESV
jgi:hypothetical protein